MITFAVLNIAGHRRRHRHRPVASEADLSVRVLSRWPRRSGCLALLGQLPRVKASTKGEGHERRYFYGSVWAVCWAQPALWLMWKVIPRTRAGDSVEARRLHRHSRVPRQPRPSWPPAAHAADRSRRNRCLRLMEDDVSDTQARPVASAVSRDHGCGRFRRRRQAVRRHRVGADASIDRREWTRAARSDARAHERSDPHDGRPQHDRQHRHDSKRSIRRGRRPRAGLRAQHDGDRSQGPHRGARARRAAHPQREPRESSRLPHDPREHDVDPRHSGSAGGAPEERAGRTVDHVDGRLASESVEGASPSDQAGARRSRARSAGSSVRALHRSSGHQQRWANDSSTRPTPRRRFIRTSRRSTWPRTARSRLRALPAADRRRARCFSCAGCRPSTTRSAARSTR